MPLARCDLADALVLHAATVCRTLAQFSSKAFVAQLDPPVLCMRAREALADITAGTRGATS